MGAGPYVPQPVPGGAPAMASHPAQGVRPDFKGTGGELFVELIVGAILLVVTLGIYTPWFVCKLNRYVYARTTLGPTQRGDLQLQFTGTGGDLFVTFIVGGLLTMVTLGIYGAWFLTNLMKFMASNSLAAAPDGTRYRLRYTGTGGELFATLIVNAILTVITFGIYAPWFMCKLNQAIYQKTEILENDQLVGGFDFRGHGGDLFVTYLVGYLLTLVTLGIYGAWWQVNLFQFFARGTHVRVHDRELVGDFVGTGGELFVTFLVGYILTMLTLGIYSFWFMARLLAFQYNNHVFRLSGMHTHAIGAGPGQAQQLGA